MAAEISSVCALNALTFRVFILNSSLQQKAHLFISRKTQVLSELISYINIKCHGTVYVRIGNSANCSGVWNGA